MSREWNPTHFFRQTTHQVVSAFAKTLEIPPPRPECSPLVWWRELSEIDRTRVDPHLHSINELCSEKGRGYLEVAARKAWATDDKKLARVPRSSSPDLALLLKVEAPSCLATASQSLAIDSTECRTEFTGKQAITAPPSSATLDRLREALARRIHESSGSDRCVVDEHRDDGRLAVFVWHETDAASPERFDEQGALVAQLRRDVACVAAIYHLKTGALRVKAPREADRRMIRQIFGEILFDDVDFFQVPSTPRFRFDALGRPGFALPPSPQHGIERVGVAYLALAPAGFHPCEVGLRFEPPVPVEIARDHVLSRRFDLRQDDISEVTLRIAVSEYGVSRTRTVYMQSPNTSNLNETPRDRSIREYLAEAGLYTGEG